MTGPTTSDRTFTYNCNGSRLTATNVYSSTTTNYTWNAHNRLTRAAVTISGSPGGSSANVYDAGGQRALRVDSAANGDVVKTVYMGAIEFRWTSTSPTAVQALRSYAGAQRGYDGTLTWTADNTQGSVTNTSTNTGVVTTTRYTPYGSIRSGDTSNDRGFLNQTTDAATGLNYLNNRYLDPITAMFISVDPLVATTRQPYLYANGSPAALSDPNGLSPEDACRASGGGGACARAAFDRLSSMPIPTGPTWTDPMGFGSDVFDFDRDVAGYLGSFTHGNSFELWGQMGVDQMDPAARLAFVHAGALWVGGALASNGNGGLKTAGDLDYVYFNVRTYLDPTAPSGAHREIETLFTDRKYDPYGDMLDFFGSLAGVTFIVAGSACLAGAVAACPIAGAAAGVGTAASVLTAVDTCFGDGSDRACGGASFDAVLNLFPTGRLEKGADFLLGLMATVVGGGVSLGLADPEGTGGDALFVSSMAAG